MLVMSVRELKLRIAADGDMPFNAIFGNQGRLLQRRFAKHRMARASMVAVRRSGWM